MSDLLSFLVGAAILFFCGKMLFGKKARRSGSGGFTGANGNDPFEDKGSYDLDEDAGDGDAGDDGGDSGGSDD